MLWITVTSGCFAFVFRQPMGIGLEIRLARGPDFQRMTKGATGDEGGLRAIISLVLFHMVGAGAYGHKMHDIHVCAFAVQTK